MLIKYIITVSKEENFKGCVKSMQICRDRKQINDCVRPRGEGEERGNEECLLIVMEFLFRQ
jgi:hypothetical protein